MSSKIIIKVYDSVANSFLRRESTELTSIGLQRRALDVIVAHDEKTQETSLNSTNSKTKVTFSSVFENQYVEHETNHATLDMSCSTNTIKLQ